jgi:esterase/lipase superfamily enzyme
MQVPAEVIKRLGEDRAANLRLDRGREKLTAADVFKRVRHRHLSRQTFTGSLKARLSRSALAKDQALIFIHGFNVDFDEATKRLSQVAFDLEFDGALVAFSWPSMGSEFRYLTDTARADASVDQFIAFLDQLSSDLPEVTLHVMAHSMGNRILTRALHKIALRPKDAARPKLGEIILAHADATPEWCAKLGKARDYVRGITNYANRDDAALRVSSTIRVGEDRCGLDPIAYDGIETIDTTGMGGERESLLSVMFGAKDHHGVFANDPLLFGDISRLIASGQRPAHERTPEFAQRKDPAGGTYWAFDPSRVLGAESKVVQAD